MRGAQPWKTERARALRSRAPAAEARLWARLRNRQLGGLKFVRQAPIESYVVDFLCREAMLIVEVDGATHGEPSEIEADRRRTTDLERAGYKELRVQNCDVRENMAGVLEGILAVALKRASS